MRIADSRTVLEPISTANLTAADVPDLAIRTHGLMEAALSEISRGVEKCQESPYDSNVRSITSTGVHEVSQPVDGASGSSGSLKSRRQADSETGSAAESESDEGMVIVGRPTK